MNCELCGAGIPAGILHYSSMLDGKDIDVCEGCATVESEHTLKKPSTPECKTKLDNCFIASPESEAVNKKAG